MLTTLSDKYGTYRNRYVVFMYNVSTFDFVQDNMRMTQDGL